MTVVEVSGVDFGYDGETVLSEVSFSVAQGDFVALVGPNGGGKTTLLKLVLGLLKPRAGRVLLFGQPPERVRSRVGYLPQHALLDPSFPVSVLDVVLMGRLGADGGPSLGPWGRAQRDAARQALEEVQAERLAGRPFRALSGGQRQRVLIARALATRPELLVLDEPTAGVDAQGEKELYTLLSELNRSVTILLVTHDLGFVSTFVNQVVCVNRRVVMHPTSQVTGEVISEIYGREVAMVRHDHKLPHAGGCFHD